MPSGMMPACRSHVHGILEEPGGGENNEQRRRRTRPAWMMDGASLRSVRVSSVLESLLLPLGDCNLSVVAAYQLARPNLPQ